MRHVSDLHIHTLVSHHAYSTVLENAQAARDVGLSMIAITDHCYGAPDAGNRWHFGNMEIWPPVMAGVRVLRGMEANVMDFSGTLDATVHDLEVMDYVVASLHPYCVTPGCEADHTGALLAVLDNPLVDAIGHPADMKFDVDYDALACRCAQRGKRLELNEHAMARAAGVEEKNVRLLAACARYGTQVVLSSDAHISFEVGRFARLNALLEKTRFPEELIWNLSVERVLRDLGIPEGVDPRPIS